MEKFQLFQIEKAKVKITLLAPFTCSKGILTHPLSLDASDKIAPDMEPTLRQCSNQQDDLSQCLHPCTMDPR